MSSNFINLFNQVANMVINSRPTSSRTPNFSALNNTQSSLFNGLDSINQSILPEVDLSNPTEMLQQDLLVNQQLQETISQTQDALKEFTQEDKSALVKAMLDLPEDMSELLKNLVNDKKNLTNTELMKLLSTMNSKGKEALNKLSKLLIVFGANNLKGTDQLQELYSVLNAFTSGNVQNASQLMKNMILMYLPWLPLGENNNFDIGLKSNDEEGGGGGSASDSVVIQIQTVNYSNVGITLSQSGNSSDVNMFIDCSENFPKAQLKEILDSDAKNKNVSVDMSFSQTRAADSASGQTPKNDKMSYNMNVSKAVSPQLLLMSQAVVKAVIEIDKHSTLIDKRKNS